MDGGLHGSYGEIYKAIKDDCSDHISSLDEEWFDDSMNYLFKLVSSKG